MNFDQADFEIRCEWGLRGLRALAPISDVVIIVDVLSFSTALDVATSRGAVIYPYRFKDATAAAYAASIQAELASAGRGPGYSLSPASLQSIEAGTRLVLPSPNGAALAFAAEHPNPSRRLPEERDRGRGACRRLGHDHRRHSRRRDLGHRRTPAVRGRPGRRGRGHLRSPRQKVARSTTRGGGIRPLPRPIRQASAIAVPARNCRARLRC